jgi:carbonic anhydrase/acetyltransferase-like protein (isoleucine patch superfamily)
MLVEHLGRRPKIHPTAVIAPGAIISGDVTIGEETCVLHGAVITSQGGAVTIGRHCVVMENAIVRATARQATTIGKNCLIGPNCHVTGATIEDNVFLATGSAVFNGAVLRERAAVRIHGVVHVNTTLMEDSVVPIGWIAVGSPAEIRPPNQHDEIWAIQQQLDFPGTVFGLKRAQPGESVMPEAMRRYCHALATHHDDVIIEEVNEK